MSWFPIQALVGFYFFSLPTDVNLLKINIPLWFWGPFPLDYSRLSLGLESSWEAEIGGQEKPATPRNPSHTGDF